MIELFTVGWRSGPVVEARTFLDRLIGIKRLSQGEGLLLRTRSIHTFGMAHPLAVVALSPQRRVLTAGRVSPGQVIRIRGALEYLELDPARTLPDPGACLTARPIVTG